MPQSEIIFFTKTLRTRTEQRKSKGSKSKKGDVNILDMNSIERKEVVIEFEDDLNLNFYTEDIH